MGYRVLSKYRPELMGGAMLWVMLFHAGDLEFGWEALNWLRGAGFGGVDIFLVLSAMGLVLSLERKEQDISAFMARRAVRILPAYYVVMLAFTLPAVIGGETPVSTLIWNSSLLYYWVAPKGAFNWYVAGIMLFYALTPFCFRRLKRSRHRILWTACGMALGLLCCRLLIVDKSWHYLDFFFRVPVFLLGLLIGFYVWEDRKLFRRDVLFWMIWLAAGLVYLAAALHISDQVFYLPLCHLFLFTTVPMCLAGCWCFERLPLGWLRKFLRLVGENSLEIYLLNVSFFYGETLLRQYLDVGPGCYFYYLVTFSLNIALGILLHRGVQAALESVRARRAVG